VVAVAAVIAACGEDAPSNGGGGGAGKPAQAAGAGAMGGTAMAAGTSGDGGSNAGTTAGGAPSAGRGAAGGPGASGASGASGGRGGTSGGSGGGSGAPGAGMGTGGDTSQAGNAGAAGMGGAPSDSSLHVLVFTLTEQYHHDSILAGTAALVAQGADRNWTIDSTDDPSVFSDAGLQTLDVVVFLSTTGDVLSDTQQTAFENFIRAGGGFVGIHSASDTEYDWSFYGGLVGAYFREHPMIQPATLNVEDPLDPIMVGLPDPWMRTDEWYAFKDNPRPNVKVLMTLDESSYDPGTATMPDGDHPVTWCHEYEGGRAFYTALGHTTESYADPVFMGMLERAIDWAGGRL
jgi:type 1 glutamine amidotransferase